MLFEFLSFGVNCAYLFIFSDGQVLIGRKIFNQIAICKSEEGDFNIGMIREKEGIY